MYYQMMQICNIFDVKCSINISVILEQYLSFLFHFYCALVVNSIPYCHLIVLPLDFLEELD